MINQFMDILKEQILLHIKTIPNLNVKSSGSISITAIVKRDGIIVIPKAHLDLTVINNKEVRLRKIQVAPRYPKENPAFDTTPEIKLNLYIILAPNFSNDSSGLKFLTTVLNHYRGKNNFNIKTIQLKLKIEKLLIEQRQ